MSAAAAGLFLAAADAIERERVARSTSTDAATVAAQAAARALEEDGGLIAYAERLARRRYPMKAASMRHLAPIAERCEAAERAMRGQEPPVFAVMHAPVQHAKTSLLQAFVLRTLRRNPRARIGYVSFNAERATEKMWEARELAAGEGIHLHPTFNTKKEWRTIEGGLVRAGGILDGAWTGGDFDILIPDDLYSGPSEAESAAHRQHIERAFETVLETRGQGRMSILTNMARWHPQDISGVLIRKGWPYTCLPAIDREGRALWPDVYPLDVLLAKRDGRPATKDRPGIAPVARRTWSSLYQGQPVPDGARIFAPDALRTYDALPEGPYLETLGIDVAYGAKARNDKSAIVGWRTYLANPRELYLVEPWLGHEVLELFACRVAAVQIRRAGGPTLALPASAAAIDGTWAPPARARRTLTWWYAGGTEIGGEGMFRVYGAEVQSVRAGIDKVARAQGGYVDPAIGGYTSAWNEGRVWWPREESEHATALRVEHEDFTGAASDDDDGVDAAVAGHDAMQLLELTEMRAAEERRQRDARTRAMAAASSRHELGPAGRAPRV